MTLGDFLKRATQALQQAGLESARLDALLLLEDALQRDRALLLAHPELELTAAEAALLNSQLEQRATHLPLAYIRGKSMFYGRIFTITPRVLVPRPESEAMMNLLLAIRDIKHLADIGTGSGCLGITAALELPECQVDLYDIDAQALDCATKNAHQLGTKVRTYHEDLASNIYTPGRPVYETLLANLPYVPDEHHINKAASHEPRLALFGGPDGLNMYRRMFAQLAVRPHRPIHVITEALSFQHQPLTDIAKASGYQQAATEGLAQHFIIA
ncbi:MAG TPA: HemK/PrmC family methyltransferase [Bacillota bacterium]|nr:HemK/PrmC family methyltransferase [Bacillota bacterium]